MIDHDGEEVAISLNDLRRAIHGVMVQAHPGFEMRQLLRVLRGAEHSWTRDQLAISELTVELQDLRYRFYDLIEELTAEYERAREVLDKLAPSGGSPFGLGYAEGIAAALDVVTGRPKGESA